MSLLGETAELAVLLKLKDEITGPLNKIDRSLSGLNTRTATVSGGMSKIGGGLGLGAERAAVALVTIGGVLAGVSIKATDAARVYQADMELLRTQTGASQAEVDSMSKSVLALAGPTATSGDVLAAGLYHIESAGKRGAEALEILRVAALGAKTGNADLESVTNALVAAEQSGVKGASNMEVAMGTLNGIVGSGNMRMQDLADAMGSGILASAKTFGVSLGSVGAALATMTDEGVPAVDASTRLRMSLSLLGAPSSKAASELKAIGIGSLDMANMMRSPQGLVGAIGLLRDHMVKAGLIDATGNINSKGAQLLSNAFGGGKSSSTIMTLVGNYALLQQKQEAVNKGALGFGDAVSATEQTVAFKRAQMSAQLDTLKLQLGNDLLPAEGAALDGLVRLFESPAVTQGIDDFGKGIASLFSPENISGAEKFAEGVIPEIESFAKGALPSLIAGLKISGSIVKEAFDLFNGLPEPLKAAIIGGLAVNKLSGGLIGSGVMDIIKATAGGAAGGSGVGGGVVGGLLGVQKVFVVNMGVGGMGGGLPLGGAASGGEAAVGGEAAAAAGGIGLGTVALVVGAVAATGFAAYLASQLPGQVAAQNADAAANQQAWVNTTTTPQQNADALRNQMKVWNDQMSNPFNAGLADIPGTGLGSTEAHGLEAAAKKIAEGTSITPDSIAAISDAIKFAQGSDSSGLRDAVPALQGYLRQANLLQAQQIAGGGILNKIGPVALSQGDKTIINSAANAAHRDVMSQLKGHLDTKKAIADGVAVAKLYESGTATSTKWTEKNIRELTGVQKLFAARGDTVTAAALGVDIAALKEVVANGIPQITAAIGRIPGPQAGGGGVYQHGENVNPGGTTQPSTKTPMTKIQIINQVSPRDVTAGQQTRTGYRAGVPQ